MKTKPYAICRVKKIHDFEQLSKVQAHNYRQIPAGVVEGAPVPHDWVEGDSRLARRASEKLKKLGAKWEEGQILAVEFMVSASPEWWATATFEMKKRWIIRQWEFANHKCHVGLLSFTPHVDESTPHVQFVGLPLVSKIRKKTGPKPKKPETIARQAAEAAAGRKSWHLSYHDVFGGKSQKLADLQDEYHGFVADLGLARGEDTRGQNKKHVPLKELRLQLRQEAEQIEVIKAYYASKMADLDQRESDQRQNELILRQNWQVLQDMRKEFDEQRAAHLAEAQRLKQDQQEMSDREAEIERAKASLDRRADELITREASIESQLAEIEKRERTLAENEKSLRNDQQDLSARQDELATKQDDIASREEKVTHDQNDLAVREREVAKRERSVETILVQVGILCRIMLGSMKATWNDEADEPEVPNPGVMTTEEAEALKQPIPKLLKRAMRVAIEFATRRQNIKNIIKRAFGVVRIHRADAHEKLAEAERAEVSARKFEDEARNRLLDADRRARVSEEQEARADQAKLRAIAERDEAKAELERLNARITEANEYKAQVLQQAQKAEHARRTDEDAMLSIEQRRRAAKNELAEEEGRLAAARNALLGTERLRESEAKHLEHLEQSRRAKEIQRDAAAAEAANLRTEVDQARIELAAIKRSCETLEEERAAVDSKWRELERQRKESAEREARSNASLKIYDHIVEKELEVTIDEQKITWRPYRSQTNEDVGEASLGDVDPRVIQQLQRHQKLVAYERVTVAQRIEVNKLHNELNTKRQELAKLDPLKRPALMAENEADKERVRALNEAYREVGRGR